MADHSAKGFTSATEALTAITEADGLKLDRNGYFKLMTKGARRATGVKSWGTSQDHIKLVRREKEDYRIAPSLLRPTKWIESNGPAISIRVELFRTISWIRVITLLAFAVHQAYS